MAKQNLTEPIDNLYWYMREEPAKAIKGFMRAFKYNHRSKMFSHERGAKVRIYDSIPELPIDLSDLSAPEKSEFKKRYNLGGVVMTGVGGSYGAAIPAIKAIAAYCKRNNVSSAFSSIRNTPSFTIHDPERGVVLNIRDLERRLKENPRPDLIERRAEEFVFLN